MMVATTAIALDMTVNLGTIIHLVVLVGSILGVWTRIERRMTIVEERLRSQDIQLGKLEGIVLGQKGQPSNPQPLR